MGDVVKYWRGGASFIIPCLNLHFGCFVVYYWFLVATVWGSWPSEEFLRLFFPLLLETGKREGLQVANCPSPDQIRLRKVFPWRASLPYSERSKNRITLGKFQNTFPSPPPEAPEEFSPFLTIQTWWGGWGCLLETKLLRSEPALFLTLHTEPPVIPLHSWQPWLQHQFLLPVNSDFPHHSNSLMNLRVVFQCV